MAERRMFAKTIIDSDAFLDMPVSAQALYFHLAMRADDDGFVNAPMKIQRIVGASTDDLRLLAAKRFILVFESGVIVIKHWRIHNYIQNDRHKDTLYKEEMDTLVLDEKKAYTERDKHPCIQNGYRMDTQVRLDKDSLDKVRLVEDGGESISPPPAEDKTVISLPLNDGSEYPITQEQIDKWRELYPAVDVVGQLRKMVGWLDSHKERRKTKRGINAFVTGWLGKEQDRTPQYKTDSRYQSDSYVSSIAKYAWKLKEGKT